MAGMETTIEKRTVISAALLATAIVLVYVPQFVSLNTLVALPVWIIWAITFSPPPLFGAGIGNLFRRPVFGALLAVLIYLLFCVIRYRLFTSGHFVPNL